MNPERLRRILTVMLDEREFLAAASDRPTVATWGSVKMTTAILMQFGQEGSTLLVLASPRVHDAREARDGAPPLPS